MFILPTLKGFRTMLKQKIKNPNRTIGKRSGVRPKDHNYPNLLKSGKGRRTYLKNKPRYFQPSEFLNLIESNQNHYTREADPDGSLKLRDLALISTIYISSGRIGEVLAIRRDQIAEDKETKWLVIQNFRVSKRLKSFNDPELNQQLKQIKNRNERKLKKAEFLKLYPWSQNLPYADVPLPSSGDLAPFTQHIKNYLAIQTGEFLFPFKKARALQIVNYLTVGYKPKNPDNPREKVRGLPCHFIRGLSLSYYTQLLRSNIVISDLKKIVNANTILHYFVGNWKNYLGEFNRSIDPDTEPPKEVEADTVQTDPKPPMEAQPVKLTEDEFLERMEFVDNYETYKQDLIDYRADPENFEGTEEYKKALNDFEERFSLFTEYYKKYKQELGV